MSYTPAPHQVEGVKLLLDNEQFALFDDPGTGKSKTVIDAAQALVEAGKVSCLLVICPAQVVSVWFDELNGELSKHVTCDVQVYRMTNPMKSWEREVPGSKTTMKVVITSYEMMRRADRKAHLMSVLPNHTMMVCDESHALKNHASEQCIAVRLIRYSGKISRCYLMTGSPCDQSPLDLFGQLQVMNKDITSMNYHQFRAHYCKMGGYRNKQIKGFKNLESLAFLLQHWCRRVKEDDVWSLPTKHHKMVESPMDHESWESYCNMRDDLVTMLNDPSLPEGVKAANHAVKVQKLAQIANGHLKGSAEDMEDMVYIHDHKVQSVLAWLEQQDHPDNFIIWTQFRADVDMLMVEMDGDDRYDVFAIQGGMSQSKKDAIINQFQTGQTAGVKSKVLIINAQAGKQGLNMASVAKVFYMSQAWSLTTHRQTSKRTHRKGQDRECEFTYCLATGPNGEDTIDHAIYMALRNKQVISTWTTDHWREAHKGRIMAQEQPQQEKLFAFGDIV